MIEYDKIKISIMNKKTKQPSGFTIIEALLTLAIGSSILMLALIAVPYLIRNQKDNERKDGFSSFLSKLSTYQANNRKALPTMPAEKIWFGSGEGVAAGSTTWFAFYNDYLKGQDNFQDPNGYPYKLSVTICSAATGTSCGETDYITASSGTTKKIKDFYNKKFPNNYILLVVINGKCRDSSVYASHGGRNVAIIYQLENGGTYCGNI